MGTTLTVSVEEARYLTPADRMVCRESITRVSLALMEHYMASPSSRDLPSGLLQELSKVMDLV